MPPELAAESGGRRGDEDESSPPAMSNEQVEEFFQNTMARLTSPEEREDIKSKVREGRNPVQGAPSNSAYSCLLAAHTNYCMCGASKNEN